MDIVERLRQPLELERLVDVACEAADEIERLRGEYACLQQALFNSRNIVEQLRQALREVDGNAGCGCPCCATIEDIARRALATASPSPP